MSDNNSIDIEIFKKSYKTALEKTAQKIGKEIEKAYESQITRFYNDYTPILYKRTNSTWWASSGYRNYESWSTYLGDLQYQAGINIDPANIQSNRGDPYRADTDWVFNRTWHLGIHGINKNNRRFKRKKRRNGTEYEVSWNYRRFPTNTRPSPEKEFKSMFSKIKTHKHIDDIFSKYWIAEINKL